MVNGGGSVPPSVKEMELGFGFPASGGPTHPPSIGNTVWLILGHLQESESESSCPSGQRSSVSSRPSHGVGVTDDTDAAAVEMDTQWIGETLTNDARENPLETLADIANPMSDQSGEREALGATRDAVVMLETTSPIHCTTVTGTMTVHKTSSQ